jgi:hypothetical protein
MTHLSYSANHVTFYIHALITPLFQTSSIVYYALCNSKSWKLAGNETNAEQNLSSSNRAAEFGRNPVWESQSAWR